MDRSTRVSLVLAVVAHAVAFAAVRPRAVRDTNVTESATAVTIEMVEEEAVKEEAPSEPAMAQAAPAIALPSVAPKVLAHLTTTHPDADTIVIPEPSAPAGSGSVATSEPTKPKPYIPPLIDTTSPGKHTFILPPSSSGQPMTKEEKFAAKLDATIKGALDAKAQQVDGGYGGPVVSAAHGAASSIYAPQVGHATFDIETDSKGVVTSVKLVDFGGDLGWQRVQKELQANLATQTLKVPSGAAGVHVRVRVQADMKLPSGSKGGIEPNGLGFGFDVADIGAVKKRVVAVQLVEQHRL